MIEDVVCSALVASPALSALTRYGSGPAIFYTSAADDTDAQWGSSRYPHCIYVIRWSDSADRVKAGQLLVDIVSNNMDEAPANIAEALIGDLSQVFVTEGGQTYCIVWKQSDQFEVGGGEQPVAYGVTLTFQMMAFPKITMPKPDVVQGIMGWLKSRFSALKVIGLDDLDAIWRASDAHPACYVRLDGLAVPVRPTYACVWMQGSFAVHIISPGQVVRVNLLSQIANLMAIEGSILLGDRSPFLLQRLAMRAGADPLADGQMVVVGEYGVLRSYPDEPLLQDVEFGRR